MEYISNTGCGDKGGRDSPSIMKDKNTIFGNMNNRNSLNKNLMSIYKLPLLYIKVNYPSDNAENNLTDKILNEMDKLICDIYKENIELKLFTTNNSGPHINMIVKDDPIKIKENLVFIEDNFLLARCVNMSVYENKTFKEVTRKDIGVKERKCIICGEYEEVCQNEKRHTNEEYIRYINKTYIEYTSTIYDIMA